MARRRVTCLVEFWILCFAWKLSGIFQFSIDFSSIVILISIILYFIAYSMHNFLYFIPFLIVEMNRCFTYKISCFHSLYSSISHWKTATYLFTDSRCFIFIYCVWCHFELYFTAMQRFRNGAHVMHVVHFLPRMGGESHDLSDVIDQFGRLFSN